MRLSIITINKNNAKGLEKTCLSIFAQTFKDFEWIIIDGNSNDNSINIIKQYSEILTFWISEPDTGIYNAMNKGIKKSTGDYLLFLNSGDYLVHPWTLRDLIDEIQNIGKQADIFYSDAIRSDYNIWALPDKITVAFLIRRTIQHQNSLIRKGLFNHSLYNEDYRIISDWLFYLTEKINHNIFFYHIKTYIAVYDNTGVSLINNKKASAERNDALRELNLLKESFLEKTLYSIVKFLKLIKYILPYGIYKLISNLKTMVIKYSLGRAK